MHIYTLMYTYNYLRHSYLRTNTFLHINIFIYLHIPFHTYTHMYKFVSIQSFIFFLTYIQPLITFIHQSFNISTSINNCFLIFLYTYTHSAKHIHIPNWYTFKSLLAVQNTVTLLVLHNQIKYHTHVSFYISSFLPFTFT